MEENKMGFFKKFLNSLYNFKAYNTFLSQTTGKAVLYLFILCAFLGFINCFSFVSYTNTLLPTLKEDIKENAPEFEFKDGKLTVDGDMPIVVKYKPLDTIVYIDTENPIDNSVLDGYYFGILITSDSLSIKQDENTQSINLSSLVGITIDKDILVSSTPDKLPMFFSAMYYIFFVISLFLENIVGAFIILGIAGIILSKIMKKQLRYSECFRLGLYALTVPMLLSTLSFLLVFLDIVIPYSIYISYAIAIIYLGFGIKSIDNSTIEKQEEFDQLY